MKKEDVIKKLKAHCYNFKKRGGYADTHYHMVKIGKLNVYIYVSNQVRVLIETSGKGSYFIVLSEKSYSFKDVEIRDVVKQFDRYVKACKEFEPVL